MFFNESGELLGITNTTALVFIDETGEETLKDPYYPFFGFGGCIIPASLYMANIVKPWNMIKEKYFGKKDESFHAYDLKNPSKEQLKALNRFFSTFQFGRFATIFSNDTVLETKHSLLHIASASIYSRTIPILKNTDHSNIVMIFESNERIERSITDYVSRYNIERETQGEKVIIPIERVKMDKSSYEPGLEVADFIIHTAGTTCRSILTGKIKRPKMRKDFNNVFGSIDGRLVSFLHVTSVKDS